MRLAAPPIATKTCTGNALGDERQADRTAEV
jgi:hypothetical protein